MKANVPIKDAERISRERNCPVVIIFTLEGNGESFGVTTYGKTKALCRHAADLGKKISQKVFSQEITPAQQEPKELPDIPTEWG